jgi:myo-inositol 2-dehydrogenase/D-chiro-inositol 1-dehydrogenase
MCFPLIFIAGIIHDSAVHDIDIVCWLVGQFPNQVFATGVSNRQEFADIGDYDTLTIQLRFPSGTIGLIDLSRFSSYGYDQRIEVRHACCEG